MAFPADTQKKINELLTLIVQAGDSASLDRLLANNFMPDNQVDLIKVAAGIGDIEDDRNQIEDDRDQIEDDRDQIGDDRDQVLAVLLRNGVK